MSTRIHIGPRTAEELKAFERELDAIGEETRRTLGEKDARYIRRIQRIVRVTEVLGRALLMFGWFPPTWILGAGLLGVSKIIDNMELGHNVMHGQFNFMNDPQFHGDTFDWDNTCPKEEWRHSHNYVHHTFTNVIGKDRDFGYGMLRLSNDLRWSWLHPFQLLLTMLLAAYFQWFVAIHDMQMDKVVIGRRKWSDVRPQWLLVRAKMWKIVKRDYVVWPLVAALVGLPFGASVDMALAVLAGNAVGNLIRNIWAWAIIFCGHFRRDLHLQPRVDRRRDQGSVVPAPDPGLEQHQRQQAAAPDERQPVAPGRAPPLPGHPGQPLHRDGAQGSGRLQQVRGALQHRRFHPAAVDGVQAHRTLQPAGRHAKSRAPGSRASDAAPGLRQVVSQKAL